MKHNAGSFKDSATETRSLRILLVEDNEMNQYVANSILGELGHLVRIANDGQEAVDTYVPGEQDIILMDLNMPRMNGLEAAKHIRSIIGDNRTPIIAVSAGAAGINEHDVIAIGMNAYMLKPVNWDELNTMISDFAKPSDETAEGASDEAVDET